MDNRKAKDLELINTYLDHEMNDQDLLDFAERLSQEENLKEDLADIMQVRSQLRKLPMKKPPQNYILTRSMAQEVRKPNLLERFFPIFRTAAVFACIAFVLTFILPLSSISSSTKTEPMLAKKSVEIDLIDKSDEANSEKVVTPEVFSEESVNPLADSELMVQAFPSKGVRGGNPKLEYLTNAERMIPDDRSPVPTPEISSQPISGEAAQKEIQNLINGVSESQTTGSAETIIRLVSIGILAVSLFWIAITLIKRRQWA